VQSSATSTSPATTPSAPRRMRGPSARRATSPAFASWKSSRHISDSDFDVSEDSSPEGLFLRVDELEYALCNQDKLLGKVFRENKKLNLELKSSFSEIASLRSAHDDMSAKPYDRCTMIMVNYADL
jgi:hypothetical protein